MYDGARSKSGTVSGENSERGKHAAQTEFVILL